jgi:4-hydroxy-2-oxoheptanedioate aldolase
MPRAAGYGSMSVRDYFARSAAHTVVAVQCESAEGLEQVDSIAAVDGIDVVFLGPFDLSHSLGIPGEVEHPKVKEAQRRVLEACTAHGTAAGIFVGSGDAARRRAEEGFRYITVSMDSLLLAKAARGELAAARGR